MFAVRDGGPEVSAQRRACWEALMSRRRASSLTRATALSTRLAAAKMRQGMNLLAKAEEAGGLACVGIMPEGFLFDKGGYDSLGTSLILALARSGRPTT